MKKGNIYSVYVLICPIEKREKYVGMTRELEKRYLSHMQSPLPSVKKWVNELRDKDLWPEMKELEKGSEIKMREREVFWINHFVDMHGFMLNRKQNKKAIANLPITYLDAQWKLNKLLSSSK